MSAAAIAAAPAAGADFYSVQAANRRRSAVLILVFTLAVVALGGAIDVLCDGYLQADGERLPFMSLGALALAAASAAVAYVRGAQLVLASLHATPLDPANPEHRQLFNIVTEMALASGLPCPQLYVIPDLAPNALSAGRDPYHAVLVVTAGLLNLLDREEMQGVVAHEMGHIANRDTLTMTLVSVLLGGALLLADGGRRAVYLGRAERRRSLLAYLIMLLAIAVTPVLSRVLAMAVSRQREYLADATAVQLTRNPLGLASALEKIGMATSPLRDASSGTAHLFIANPWPRALESRDGWLADLLSTHPPVAQRIAVLHAMAHTG